MPASVSTAQLLAGLKAAGEATRLRIIALLMGGELNVKDLTQVLGQSQPRISRHLKLLVEARLIERYREGSWVYFRIAEGAVAGHVRDLLGRALDPADRILQRDRERAHTVNAERSAAAQRYFEAHAAEWDRIRALHAADLDVEKAMIGLLEATTRRAGERPETVLVDLGTGTGRILELLSDRVDRAVGIDMNQAMLAYARARLEAQGLRHCQVRQGDLYDLPLADGMADIVVLHQVLHFLDDPGRAVREAARLLRADGRLLIVDFAPHDLDFLRDEFAHRRLGLSTEQMRQWAESSGLEVKQHRELAAKPAAGASKDGDLVVSLWLCEMPARARAAGREKDARKGSPRKMEIVT